ncbi:MAG: hypothetical protein AAB250_11885, partial [Bdellovibrionota bacterium]
SSQPVSQRFAFALKWSKYLARARAREGKGGTRNMLGNEIETLMPAAEFPEAMESLRQALTDARLLEPASIEADLLVRKATLDESDTRAIEVLLRRRPRLAVFARTEKGLVSFPGAVVVDPKDLSVSRVKHEVVQTCKSPSLVDIAKREVPTKRLVWIRHCDKSETALVYGPLLAVGMEGFARANPGVTFIQLRPEAVAFALRSGHASGFEGAEALVEVERRRKDPWFGIASATWVDSAAAFRVNGAIEAVEWHRTAKAPGTSGEF